MTQPSRNVPIPDPTEQTTIVIHRELQTLLTLLTSKLDAVNIRIDGIDRATVVFREAITRVPTEVDKAIAPLRELMLMQVENIKLEIVIGETRSKERAMEMDLRMEQRFQSSGVALAAASVAAEKAIAAALSAADRSVQSALAAASASVSKSDQSTEKRFEAVDAIRMTLAETQTKLMPRIESEARLQSVAEKVADLSTRFENVVGRHAGQASSQTTLITLVAIGVSVVIGMISFFASHNSQSNPQPAAVAVVPVTPSR